MKLIKLCPSCGAKLSYAEEIQTNCSYCGERLLMDIPDDVIYAEARRRRMPGMKKKPNPAPNPASQNNRD